MMHVISLVSMILVLFIFIDKYELKDVEKIFKHLKMQDSDQYIAKKTYIKSNLEIIKMKTVFQKDEKMPDSEKQYVMLYKEGIEINDGLKDLLIYNYIISKTSIAVFEGSYILRTNNEKKKFKKIQAQIMSNFLNYINIFDKENIDNYFVIIAESSELQNIKTKRITHFFGNNINLEINIEDNSKKKELQELYVNGIKGMSIKTSAKIGLFIFSIGSVTLNLIRSVINITDNFYAFLVSLAIYYCYTMVVKCMYRSIGKMKYVFTYMFPIYILVYFTLMIYIGIHSLKKA